MLFYKPSLERLGITRQRAHRRRRQYENRLRNWDFDIITASWGQSLSPGNEQRDFWGSQAADQPGSRNYVGIKNPAVDALIERVIFAKDRDELVAATKALDRVLLWNHYVVPQWTYRKARTARWDRFGRPGRTAEIRRVGFPDHLVVGRGQGARRRASGLERSCAWRDSPAGMCSVSVPARCARRATRAGAARDRRAPKRTASRPSAT